MVNMINFSSSQSRSLFLGETTKKHALQPSNTERRKKRKTPETKPRHPIRIRNKTGKQEISYRKEQYLARKKRVNVGIVVIAHTATHIRIARKEEILDKETSGPFRSFKLKLPNFELEVSQLRNSVNVAFEYHLLVLYFRHCCEIEGRIWLLKWYGEIEVKSSIIWLAMQRSGWISSFKNDRTLRSSKRNLIKQITNSRWLIKCFQMLPNASKNIPINCLQG